ncbi:MAG: hypothetical protein ACI4IV_02940 [Acutalibacteraceae bacterium]
MGRRLYGKGIAPRCEYCAVGESSGDGTLIFCAKKGILPPDFKCRRFRYDPLKRVPRITPELAEFKKEDFEI